MTKNRQKCDNSTYIQQRFDNISTTIQEFHNSSTKFRKQFENSITIGDNFDNNSRIRQQMKIILITILHNWTQFEINSGEIRQKFDINFDNKCTIRQELGKNWI